MHFPFVSIVFLYLMALFVTENPFARVSNSSDSNESSEPQAQPAHFKTWPLSVRPQLKSSGSVSPLTTGTTARRPDYFTQTRASRSFHLSLSEDDPVQPITRPGHPNRGVTMSSEGTVRARQRPTLPRGNSMTETATRWAELADDASHPVTKPPEPPTPIPENTQLDLPIESPEYQEHVQRRWEHSNHWFKVSLGRPRSASGRRLKTDRMVRTSDSSGSRAPTVAHELMTLSSTIPEQVEQESPPMTLDEPLLSKQNQNTLTHAKSRTPWSRKRFFSTQHRIHLAKLRKLLPLTRRKKSNPNLHFALKRTATVLSKFTSARKSLRRKRRHTDSNNTDHPYNLSHQETFHSTSQGPISAFAPENRPVCPFTQYYTSTDNKRYPTVNLSEPNAPAFLPSEAARISTPPLPSLGSNGKTHNGFFDLTAPDGQVSPVIRPRLGRKDSKEVLRRSNTDSDPVWFRVRVEGSEEPEPGEGFDPNVPDHLPSSPLCPRHPKHPSGGTGNCFMHGRNRTVSEILEDLELAGIEREVKAS